jgi:hypothetical protein
MPSRRDPIEDDDDFEDEFAHEFDDIGGDILEESLARIEESYNSSQRIRPNIAAQNKPGVDLPLHHRLLSNGNGSYIPEATTRRLAPGPGLDDFRVSHQGHVQGGSKLPAGDDEYEDDGGIWGGMDLDRIESEAIVSSQRSQGHAAVAGRSRESSNIPTNDAVARASAMRGSKRARHDTSDREAPQVDSRESAGRFEREVKADMKRIEELERMLAAKDKEVKQYQQENQTKQGEVKVLRANLNRVRVFSKEDNGRLRRT